MASPKKLLARVRELVEAEGAKVLEIARTNGAHTKLRVLLPDGREATLSVSTTPKNLHYTAGNVAQDVRRLIRGVYSC